MKLAAIVLATAVGLIGLAEVSAAAATPKVTQLKGWVGKGHEEVVKAFPGKPVLDDNYDAANAAGELRAAVVAAYPARAGAGKAVRIRELWWVQGDYYLTFLMHFKGGRWVVLGAVKWHKDARF